LGSKKPNQKVGRNDRSHHENHVEHKPQRKLGFFYS